MIPKISDRGQDILNWIRWGDRDYVAARQLLIAGFLVQGASLSNTAIEKYLKAVFVLADLKIPNSHDPIALWNRLRISGDTRLNENYLRVLTKAYKLRYPDDLPPGYSIALNQVLLLTLLDKSAYAIQSRLKVKKGDGEEIPLLLNTAQSANDRRVLDGNVAFDETLMTSLYSQPSRCLDFHKLLNGAVLETEYTVLHLAPDADVEREGMEQKSDREFTLAYGPVYQG